MSFAIRLANNIPIEDPIARSAIFTKTVRTARHSYRRQKVRIRLARACGCRRLTPEKSREALDAIRENAKERRVQRAVLATCQDRRDYFSIFDLTTYDGQPEIVDETTPAHEENSSDSYALLPEDSMTLGDFFVAADPRFAFFLTSNGQGDELHDEIDSIEQIAEIIALPDAQGLTTYPSVNAYAHESQRILAD